MISCDRISARTVPLQHQRRCTDRLSALLYRLCSLLGTPTLRTVFPGVDSIQRVAITCAESFEETVRRAMSDNVINSSNKYAQSLVPDIAEVADVSESQVNDIITLEDPVNGQSPINQSIS